MLAVGAMMTDDAAAGRGAEIIRAWIDRSHLGRLVVLRDGSVLYCNAAGRELLSASAALQLRDGCLRASTRGTQDQLRVAMAAESRHYLAAHSGSQDPLMAAIDPVDDAHVVVSLWRAARPPFALLAPLAAFYGLSQQQARVAAELVAGRTVDEIARKLSISIDTVRSHLKCVYEKTGAHSQTEVLALALRCFAT